MFAALHSSLASAVSLIGIGKLVRFSPAGVLSKVILRLFLKSTFHQSSLPLLARQPKRAWESASPTACATLGPVSIFLSPSQNEILGRMLPNARISTRENTRTNRAA